LAPNDTLMWTSMEWWIRAYQILKYQGRGSQDSGLDLLDQVVKIGEGWLEQKL